MLLKVALLGALAWGDPILDVPENGPIPGVYCAGWYRNRVYSNPQEPDSDGQPANCEKTCHHIIREHDDFKECRAKHGLDFLFEGKFGGEHEVLYHSSTNLLKTYDCKVDLRRPQQTDPDNPPTSPVHRPQLYGNNVVGAGMLEQFCFPWTRYRNNFQCLCVVEQSREEKPPDDPTDPDPDKPTEAPTKEPDEDDPDQPGDPEDPNDPPEEDEPATGAADEEPKPTDTPKPPPPEEEPTCMPSSGNRKLDCLIERFSKPQIDVCGSRCKGGKPPNKPRPPPDDEKPTPPPDRPTPPPGEGEPTPPPGDDDEKPPPGEGKPPPGKKGRRKRKKSP